MIPQRAGSGPFLGPGVGRHNQRSAEKAALNVPGRFHSNSSPVPEACQRIRRPGSRMRLVCGPAWESGSQVARINARGFRTTTNYDADARPIAEVDALARRTTLQYDVAGERTQKIDGRSFAITYLFDRAGR